MSTAKSVSPTTLPTRRSVKERGRRSDEAARAWGRKKIRVTVWEYADGKPAGDPRKAR